MSGTTTAHAPLRPSIIARADHNISRKAISKAALKVLYRLKDAGFQAHLVGGGVRDLLLELVPKDFDVATDAHPEQVKSLFPNCHLIGRRFRLAHVRFGREIIEVATFRASHQSGMDGATGEDGRIVRDNVFGSIEEDAVRRDFTVNALYYNIADFSVIDYTGGLADLRSKTLRIIGDPATRYREDAVRMLRAARFSAKLGFALHPETRAPIVELGPMLTNTPPPRLFEEVLKLMQTGYGRDSVAQLRALDLLRYLFPGADKQLKCNDAFFDRLVVQALHNTDSRIAAGKPVTPAFLYAVFLWPLVQAAIQKYNRRGEPPVAASYLAADEVLSQQLSTISLPRRFAVVTREIWAMQPRLMNSTTGKRAQRLLNHRQFRAGYDFLCLREQAGEDLSNRGQQWEKLQMSTPDVMPGIVTEAVVETAINKRRRRRHSAPGNDRGTTE